MRLKVSIFCFGVFLLLACCQKEKGCTDPMSDTYNVTAEEDNGSCTYHANFVFYFNDTKALYYNNVDEIYPPMKIIIDGNLIGALNWWVATYEDLPFCDETLGTITYEHLMTSQSEDVNIYIEDSEGRSFGTKVENIKAGACRAVLL